MNRRVRSPANALIVSVASTRLTSPSTSFAGPPPPAGEELGSQCFVTIATERH